MKNAVGVVSDDNSGRWEERKLKDLIWLLLKSMRRNIEES